jgi:hypothetical protein
MLAGNAIAACVRAGERRAGEQGRAIKHVCVSQHTHCCSPPHTLDPHTAAARDATTAAVPRDGAVRWEALGELWRLAMRREMLLLLLFAHNTLALRAEDTTRDL